MRIRLKLVLAIAIPVTIFVLVALYWTVLPRYGTVEVPREGVYTGQLRGMTFHGHGTFASTALGSVSYEGYWKNGVFHGCGTLTYANGQKMIGDFRNGVPHGTFELIDSSGTLRMVEFDEEDPWSAQ